MVSILPWEMQKVGNTLDTLMLVLTPKGNAGHTSRF